MRFWFSLTFSLLAGAASGQDGSYECRGVAPEWSVNITGDTASFSYIGTSDMQVPQFSRAEGRVWPIAMTLISSDFSRTAILLINDHACNLGEDIIFPYEAQVLTQRQDTPVLLTGCCRPWLP